MSIEKRAWFSAEEIIQKYWEHKEKNMEKKDKPRLAEVLGVDENAPIRVVGGGYDTVPFTIADVTVSDGRLMAGAVTYAIIHPESIIRATRLTETELERCRVCGAKYLARGKTSHEVFMYEKKPDEVAEGSYGGGGYIGSVICRLFPSVHPGDLIEVP